MEISYLSDHPEYISVLAPWLHAEWGWFTTGSTLESRRASLDQHLNRDRLPIAVVAHDRGRPLGTASLRVHDMDTRPDLTPWLASVYVAPEARTQGIGAGLVTAIETLAEQLGFEQLHLVTFDKSAYYAKRGWLELERTLYRDEPVVLMRKSLVRVADVGAVPPISCSCRASGGVVGLGVWRSTCLSAGCRVDARPSAARLRSPALDIG
jgi:GNAT superfamily N-acetyltransferase